MKFQYPSTMMVSFLILLLALTSKSQEVPGECGEASGGALCDEGRCCSKWGFCGTTNSYCALGNCTSQCWASPPSPPPPPVPAPPPPTYGSCGIDNGGQECPEAEDMCCTVDGRCAYKGTPWCDASDCQYNCNSPPDCGGGRLCPANHCCSMASLCADHSSRACRKHCASQCPTLLFKNKKMMSMLD